MKLSPERRAELLNEMRFAELFNEGAWVKRYGISLRTIKRLRSEARQHPLMACAAPVKATVIYFIGSVGRRSGKPAPVRLKAEQRREILNEMRLAELFSEKAWARRYGTSPSTVKRLRELARAMPPVVREGPVRATVVCFTNSTSLQKVEA